MKFGKRILSALLAAVITTSSASALFMTSYAAEETKEEKTFDGEHDLSDEVDYYTYFATDNNPSEVQEALEKRLLTALGKRDISDVTFKDLLRPSTLNLSGMELEELPACLNYMTNLRTLNLSNNRLRNDGLAKLNFIGCTKLTNIDLSKNYLSRVPGWFINSRVTKRDITGNFITGENPRSLKTLVEEYYYVNGEPFDEGGLKTRILDSIRFSDNSFLPDFLFDYDNPPYKNNEVYDQNTPYPYELDFVSWNFSSFIDENGNTKVSADTYVDVTVCLFKDTTSANTKVTVRIFLLDGKSATSIKQRLDQLLAEYDSIKGKKSDYTEISWNKLDQAQQTAAAIREFEGSDTEMLSNALSMLNRAMNGLDKAASAFKSTIDALVKVGGTYKKEDYSPYTWESFETALNSLKAMQSDKNATASQAQRAIKAFQKAQLGLSGSSLSVPAIIPKSDFEKIYGEDRNLTGSGTMPDGKKYSWTFNGRDVNNLADFNPELKDTDAVEENILIEAGSPSKYRMFATAQTAAFPGKATLEFDVSGYEDGKYYLYKWNTSEKRSKMVGTASVNSGKIIAEISEGGVYYVSPNVWNFDLNSSRFKIDHSKKAVAVPLLGTYNVTTLRNSMDFGSHVIVADQNGDTVSNVSTLYSGMTVRAPGGDKYTFVVSGDLNGDGAYDVRDVTAIIDSIAKNGDTFGCDVDGDGQVNVTDAVKLIDYIIKR